MATAAPILVVSSDKRTVDSLESSLKTIGIEPEIVCNCIQARKALIRRLPPQIIFTDWFLADGDCKDVLELAARSEALVRVIVIAERMDYELYLDALDAGAADFIAPPFCDLEVACLICSVQERSRGNSARRGMNLHPAAA